MKEKFSGWLSRNALGADGGSVSKRGGLWKSISMRKSSSGSGSSGGGSRAASSIEQPSPPPSYSHGGSAPAHPAAHHAPSLSAFDGAERMPFPPLVYEMSDLDARLEEHFEWCS